MNPPFFPLHPLACLQVTQEEWHFLRKTIEVVSFRQGHQVVIIVHLSSGALWAPWVTVSIAFPLGCASRVFLVLNDPYQSEKNPQKARSRTSFFEKKVVFPCIYMVMHHLPN